jgi:hypothetical protein
MARRTTGRVGSADGSLAFSFAASPHGRAADAADAARSGNEQLAKFFGRLRALPKPVGREGANIELEIDGVVVQVGWDADAGASAAVIGALKAGS